ncbi:MAG: Yip1 family protein [Roseiarcus sp.]|jgi:hypothetical protein
MDLVKRVKGILLTPKTEWQAIEPEPGDPAYLFTNYVAILAAIPAVCRFIGMTILGRSVVGGVVSAIVYYVLTFVMVYVMALIADALAPSFGGHKNQPNALKLTVYSMTPAWLAGVFWLIPRLGILGLILGLYGLYLFWLGAPTLMKTPAEKSVLYTAAVVVCGIVISVVIFAIVHAIGWR